jgi:glycerophosphoryl diester phosphodiesterase
MRWGVLASLGIILALCAPPAVVRAEEPIGASPVVGELQSAAPDPVGSTSEIAIHAHRGGPELGAPENTIKLFRLAIASGVVDYIETDVRITKDKKLVLVHDPKLPSGCTSKGKYIHRMTWAQLSKVRCHGEPVPTLQQALRLVKGTKVGLNLELKTYSGQSAKAGKDYAKRIAKAVKSSGLPAKQVMFSSHYWRDYAATMQRYAGKFYFLAMETAQNASVSNDIYSNIRKAKKAGVDGWAVPVGKAQSSLLKFIREYGGMDTELYGRHNDWVRENRFALANGVRYYLTDHPVGSRGKLESMLAQVAAKPLHLNPAAVPLKAKKQVFSSTLKKGKKATPKLIGAKAPLPASAQYLLAAVQLEVTIDGAATVELAPLGSRGAKDGVRISNPDGSNTYWVGVSPGDQGKLQVLMVKGSAKVSVSVTGRLIANY